MVNGIKQKPIEGVSMAYTFDKANANAPSTRKTQYFEMIGNRGIYHDGWYACTTPPVAAVGAGRADAGRQRLQVGTVQPDEDYSQANDLAAKMPGQGEGNAGDVPAGGGEVHVLPLDNSQFQRAIAPRPSAIAGQTVFTYSGVMPGIPLGQRTEHPEQVVHDHRRGRGSRRAAATG